MDFKKINSKINWTYIILISIGIIFVSIYLIANEILEAKKNCNKINGEYNFNIYQGHLCNGKKFIKYNSCHKFLDRIDKIECDLIWVFEESINKINVSEFIK